MKTQAIVLLAAVGACVDLAGEPAKAAPSGWQLRGGGADLPLPDVLERGSPLFHASWQAADKGWPVYGLQLGQNLGFAKEFALTDMMLQAKSCETAPLALKYRAFSPEAGINRVRAEWPELVEHATGEQLDAIWNLMPELDAELRDAQTRASIWDKHAKSQGISVAEVQLLLARVKLEHSDLYALLMRITNNNTRSPREAAEDLAKEVVRTQLRSIDTTIDALEKQLPEERQRLKKALDGESRSATDAALDAIKSVEHKIGEAKRAKREHIDLLSNMSALCTQACKQASEFLETLSAELRDTGFELWPLSNPPQLDRPFKIIQTLSSLQQRVIHLQTGLLTSGLQHALLHTTAIEVAVWFKDTARPNATDTHFSEALADIAQDGASKDTQRSVGPLLLKAMHGPAIVYVEPPADLSNPWHPVPHVHLRSSSAVASAAFVQLIGNDSEHTSCSDTKIQTELAQQIQFHGTRFERLHSQQTVRTREQRKLRFGVLIVVEQAIAIIAAIYVELRLVKRQSTLWWDTWVMTERHTTMEPNFAALLDFACGVFFCLHLVQMVLLPWWGSGSATCMDGYPWEPHLVFSTFQLLQRLTELVLCWQVHIGGLGLGMVLFKGFCGALAVLDTYTDSTFIVIAHSCSGLVHIFGIDLWKVAAAILAFSVGFMQVVLPLAFSTSRRSVAMAFLGWHQLLAFDGGDAPDEALSTEREGLMEQVEQLSKAAEKAYLKRKAVVCFTLAAVRCAAEDLPSVVVQWRFKYALGMTGFNFTTCSIAVSVLSSVLGVAMAGKEVYHLWDVEGEVGTRSAGSCWRALRARLPCFGVEQLVREGYTAVELRHRAGSAAAFRSHGHPARPLRMAGFVVEELREGGYAAQALRVGGFSAQALREGGYDGASLRGSGFSAQTLRESGYSAQALWAAGYDGASLRGSGFSVQALREGGYNAETLRGGGYDAASLRNGGFSAQALREAGYDGASLRGSGFAVQALREGGYTPTTLRGSGYDFASLRDGGFSAEALQEAGYDAAYLLKGSFAGVEELSVGRYVQADVEALRAGGYSAATLRDYGYDAVWLRFGGYKSSELRAAGYDLRG